MRFRLLVFVVLLARVASAQVPDTMHRAPGATVSGVVRDSVSGMPLVGALVQLVAADDVAGFIRTDISDSLGWFMFSDVPSGHYLLGFLHPMLDSLGVEAPTIRVHVDGGRSVRADLAIPSPARLRAAICGPATTADPGGVVVGVVRDPEDRAPVPGVTVVAEWLELSMTGGGFTRRVQRLVATSAENGWFALCGVPRPGTITLLAGRGADSTDRIEAHVPSDGFLRRGLYLGASRIVVAGDTAGLAPLSRRVAGDVRLRGKVVTAARGEPLAGARVSIDDGPESRANDRGEWTLAGVPLGTRMLEIRAVGYYPERRAVDVVAGAAPIHTALSTMSAVLDTVRVTAARGEDRLQSGFEGRRHMSLGRYLTPEDIARRRPIVTSDLFHMVPGLRLEPAVMGETGISMRGVFSERCSPAVYLDGHYMRQLSATEIDGWVRPEEVAGIEVYAGGTAPPQFDSGMSACGSIVIWTRPVTGQADSRPMKRRLFTLLGAMTLGLVIGATLK